MCFISNYHSKVLETQRIIDQFWNSLLLWLYSFNFLSLRYSPLMINPVLVILQFIPPDPLSVLLTNPGGWPLWAVLPGLLAFWLLTGFEHCRRWGGGSIGRRWKTGGSEIFSFFFFFFSVPIFLYPKPQPPTIIYNPFFEFQLYPPYPNSSSQRKAVLSRSYWLKDAVCSLNAACTSVVVFALEFLQSFWECHQFLPHTQNVSQFLYLELIPPFSMFLVSL